jgi:hypothetical protein
MRYVPWDIGNRYNLYDVLSDTHVSRPRYQRTCFSCMRLDRRDEAISAISILSFAGTA